MSKYEGCRLFCGSCKHKAKWIDNGNYSPCKMIDHDNIRFLTTIFNGYDHNIQFTDICAHYEPASWNNSTKKEWTNFDGYIEYLDNEFYPTRPHQKNKIRNYRTITLIVGRKDCRWGDYAYEVSLYDWLKGEAVNDGSIKYLFKYEIIRTKGGSPKSKKLISENGIDKIY